MTTFPKKQLQAIVDFAWRNKCADYYREYWKDVNNGKKPTTSDLESWEKLPLLTRANLNEEKDPLKRVFIPKSTIDVLHTTSGTSGSEVFMFWRECSGNIDVQKPPMNQMKTCMFVGAYEKAPRVIVWLRNAGITMLTGDSRNLEWSAQLAKKARIDSLYIPPTLALLFAEELRKNGHATSIKVIFLWGAQCSDTTYAHLKKLYPNAHFVFTYGLSETGGSSWSSTEMCASPNTIVHVNTKSQFVEIIDGEVVLTNFDRSIPMPLIRYRTGDAALPIEGVCPCGRTDPRLKILGRIDGDFIRIAGGELRAEELDRVMKSFAEYVEHNYLLEVKESHKTETAQASFVLRIEKRPNINVSDDSLEMQIHRHLLSNMRLSQNMLLQAAIHAGLIESLDIRIAAIEPTLKHKRLVYIT